MNRSTAIAYALAAVFAVVAIVDLAVRPLHYERTLGLAVVLAVAAAAYGRYRSTTAQP
jgi:hypothetical protein